MLEQVEQPSTRSCRAPLAAAPGPVYASLFEKRPVLEAMLPKPFLEMESWLNSIEPSLWPPYLPGCAVGQGTGDVGAGGVGSGRIGLTRPNMLVLRQEAMRRWWCSASGGGHRDSYTLQVASLQAARCTLHPPLAGPWPRPQTEGAATQSPCAPCAVFTRVGRMRVRDGQLWALLLAASTPHSRCIHVCIVCTRAALTSTHT